VVVVTVAPPAPVVVATVVVAVVDAVVDTVVPVPVPVVDVVFGTKALSSPPQL
jgi:hypothetical protein